MSFQVGPKIPAPAGVICYNKEPYCGTPVGELRMHSGPNSGPRCQNCYDRYSPQWAQATWTPYKEACCGGGGPLCGPVVGYKVSASGKKSGRCEKCYQDFFFAWRNQGATWESLSPEVGVATPTAATKVEKHLCRCPYDQVVHYGCKCGGK